ncbi:MAG: folate-binding protein [Burkholderiaceae bacterium]|nr:folate-binding protein [Burkholderiaceae bacterium]
MNEPGVEPLQGVVRLADWGVIRAQGADAASFLHGQLTQDVQQLNQHSARLAGYCTAKGRLLASLIVWRTGTDELLLACSADVLLATLKRLSMFILRAKCKLSDATASVALYGLAGRAATDWLGTNAPMSVWQRNDAAGAQVLHLPDSAGLARYLLAAPNDAPPPPLPALSPEAWSWLEVTSGVARIVGATAEQFVPQMVNFELVGGVNFQKDCYPGQEIVARSQYRGTVKRRAFVFSSDAAAPPGREVFHSNDAEQPAGMVVNAASLAGSHRALVEVKLAALEAGTLHLGAADGPLLHLLAQQPYPVPIEATA